MSDKYFAVQFRCMHTAIHSVAVFSAMNQAEEFFQFIEKNEELPEEHQVDTSSLETINEINFRDIPHVFPFGDYEEGLPLEYCNLYNNIPAVYNYS